MGSKQERASLPRPRGGWSGSGYLRFCPKLHVRLPFVANSLMHLPQGLKHSPPRLVTEALNTLVRISSLFFLRAEIQNEMLGSEPLSLWLDGGDPEALRREGMP